MSSSILRNSASNQADLSSGPQKPYTADNCFTRHIIYSRETSLMSMLVVIHCTRVLITYRPKSLTLTQSVNTRVLFLTE